MDRLPQELTDAILESVSTRDIRAFRLACRRCADAGAPHLFPRVWLSSHPLDVEVFRTFLRNPQICGGVKELIWDDTTYCDSLMEKEKYFKTAKKVGSWGSWCTDLYANQEGEPGYRHFLAKAKLHHFIRRHRIDEKLLMSGLPKLKNLRSVVLSSRHHYMPWPDDVGDIVNSPTARQWTKEREFKTFAYPPTVNWKTARGSGDVRQLSTKELLPMITVEYHEDAWAENDITDASCVHVLRPFRGLLILLRALSSTNTKVENFELRPQYASKWGQDNSTVGLSHFFFREWTSDLDRFIAVARNLRRLHLVISCEDTSTADIHASAITLKRGHFTLALQSAKRLEELHLELPVPSVMRAIGYETHFPHLKSLTLMQGNVDPLELVNFIKSHRRTIQSLSLSHCNSSKKSWAALFEELKSERLHLLFIELYFCFNPDGVNWCRTMEQNDIGGFLAGNGRLPLLWTPWRGITPPPRF